MFRAVNKREKIALPISRREWLVCSFACFTLVFTAWSFGGYRDWTLHLLFLGGVGTFLASILPLPQAWNGYDRQQGNLKNLKRLLFQPFFWVSLCFLIYILVQFANPSLEQVKGERTWWTEAIAPPLGMGFPSSVRADYSEMNALRAWVGHVAAFALALGIWIGIQRRKTALLLLWAFVASGVLMGFVAILHKFSGSSYLLWIVECTNENLWGSFAYRNQGAAYLILVSLISGLLYFFYLKRSREQLNEGGPHFLCFLFIFLLFGSICLALSKGGIILGSALIVFFSFLAFLQHVVNLFKSGSWVLSFIFLMLMITGSLFMLQFFNLKEVEHRVSQLQSISQNPESYSRILSTKATWDMAQDRLLYGWGAGAFRYIFPIYQKDYESLWYQYYNKKKGRHGRLVYHYAHNDWVQFLAEYGIIGTSFLVLLFVILVVLSFKLFQVSVLSGSFYLFGLAVIAIHNFVDFIFSSPSYWVAFFGSALLVVKLYRLEFKSH